MWRIVAAVLAGYAVIGVLVVATDRAFAAFVPGFSSTNMPPGYYFWVSLATDSLYTLLGGYLCALVAGQRARNASLGLIAFGELMGLASLVAEWNSVRIGSASPCSSSTRPSSGSAAS